MNPRHTYFRFTTSQQRKLLYESWEATGSVTQACQIAHVGRATFYYWKPRFDRKGYAGLEEFESRAAHTPHRTDEAIERRVKELREQHPDWGKLRIADELAKENNWVPVISANTVRRILCDAQQWSQVERPQKGGVAAEPQISRDKP